VIDLDQLLAELEPQPVPGRYVFVTAADAPTDIDAFARIHEAEGTTLVLTVDEAERHQLPYEYVAARITLTVHSALEAVGLTAAVATALAEEGISCNVIAGYFHDHLFVAEQDGERAVAILRRLSIAAAQRLS
jgi:hypothetical protein